jgi:phosphoglycolate phosphatase-like HAD superfamily hydrolase
VVSAAGRVVELEGVLFDVTEGADAAVVDAVLAYPAMAVAPPPSAWVTRLRERGRHGRGPALVVALLRAGVSPGGYGALEGGAALVSAAAVDEGLAGRIYSEALLGEALFSACSGEAVRWVRGPGRIDAEWPRVGAAELARQAARGPLALVTDRGPAETLYLLGRFALTECFAAVVTDGGGAAEAARRLVELGLVAEAADVTVVASAGALVA